MPATRFSHLLSQMLELREQLDTRAAKRLAAFEAIHPRSGENISLRNLAYYLAFRESDRRDLQAGLAEVGLSSLGRSEAYVEGAVDRVIDVLRRLQSDVVPMRAAAADSLGAASSRRLLRQHAAAVFGAEPSRRPGRIMVTMPSEAADHPGLVQEWLQAGMDCARINCAHDDPDRWRAMIANIRQASAALGRPCRILADLAGHKIRTGPLAAAPSVLHLRPQRDDYGRIIQPATVILHDRRQPAPPPRHKREYVLGVEAGLLEQLDQGGRLYFVDTRGKHRTLSLGGPLSGGRWQTFCDKGAYVSPQTAVALQRPNGDGDFEQVAGPFFLHGIPEARVSIRLFQGDELLLTRQALYGQPARLDAEGRVVEPARIACSCAAVLDDLQSGQPVCIDDGKLGAVVESLDETGARLRIVQAPPTGVRLKADKGLNFPHTALSLPPLSEADFAALDVLAGEVDLIGFSFVESAADLRQLQQALQARGAARLPIVAKIETRRAVANLPEIIVAAAGQPLAVMIARGDLAVEIGPERLAEVQEEILWLCEAAHVPVIWATQVLETMAKTGAISRPEFTDAAMAERAECVMLNKGPYMTRVIATLDDILQRMQQHQYKKTARLRALHW